MPEPVLEAWIRMSKEPPPPKCIFCGLSSLKLSRFEFTELAFSSADKDLKRENALLNEFKNLKLGLQNLLQKKKKNTEIEEFWESYA